MNAKQFYFTAFASALLVSCSGAAFAQRGPTIREDAQDRLADKQADTALQAMTPEERRSLLHGPMPMLIAPAKRPGDMIIGAGYVSGIARLGIPALRMTDASLGVANLMNQRKGDVATALPAGLAIASSWDLRLAESAGAIGGREARAKGFNVLLAGGVNLARDPRNGRNFEYFGEDPLLSGILGGHMIRGVQSAGIISTMKHFALNDQETGRNVLSVNIGEAEMRESDLLAFQLALEIGNPGAVMCGYNRVNGVFACENDILLNQVLRRDWGFKGWVMSDWGAVHGTEALMKGLDQQSGEQIDGKPYFGALLDSAIVGGRVPESAADTAAKRILRTMFLRGVIARPALPGATIDFGADGDVAQAVAEAGIVLLKNDGNLLPLTRQEKHILVIGGHADIGVISGGGSSQVRPVGGPALEMKAPKQNGRAALTDTIVYVPSPPLAAMRAALPDAQIDFLEGADAAAAASAARTADIVIVFAERWDSESLDASDLSLGGGQDALIDAVASVNSKTIVVLETGNPVTMPWLAKVPAVLEAWFPGQRGGPAIARVLTGDVNPSGHLPITFPASTQQLPNPTLPGSNARPPSKTEKAVYGLMANTAPFAVTYPEGADVGYRWFDKTKAKPLFPFGHGLSYTSFDYAGLRVSGSKQLSVSFEVRNVGTRSGTDVPQVYATIAGTKRLIGWERVTLAAGEVRKLTVHVDRRLLARFDAFAKQWRIAAGRYTVEVGHSVTAPVLTANATVSKQSFKP